MKKLLTITIAIMLMMPQPTYALRPMSVAVSETYYNAQDEKEFLSSLGYDPLASKENFKNAIEAWNSKVFVDARFLLKDEQIDKLYEDRMLSLLLKKSLDTQNHIRNLLKRVYERMKKVGIELKINKIIFIYGNEYAGYMHTSFIASGSFSDQDTMRRSGFDLRDSDFNTNGISHNLIVNLKYPHLLTEINEYILAHEIGHLLVRHKRALTGHSFRMTTALIYGIGDNPYIGGLKFSFSQPEYVEAELIDELISEWFVSQIMPPDQVRSYYYALDPDPSRNSTTRLLSFISMVKYLRLEKLSEDKVREIEKELEEDRSIKTLTRVLSGLQRFLNNLYLKTKSTPLESSRKSTIRKLLELLKIVKDPPERYPTREEMERALKEFHSIHTTINSAA